VDLFVTTLAERPDLAPMLDDFPDAWPEFMRNDPTANLYYGDEARAYAEYVLIAIDRDAPSRAVAKGYSVPFTWGQDELPAGGWDTVVQRAALDRIAGRRGNFVSAVEIAVQPDLRGTGLSSVLVDGLRSNAARLGYDALVAPVRPSAKHQHPDVPIADYAGWTRDDGLPVDPWLRVHVRAGGVIERVAPRSMTIPGTLAEWRGWTGLPFDTTGPVYVPQALTPVHCDVAQDHAVYVEPNVWVRHRL
jgi:GNAT superfamily N-acetyltransferase